MLKTQKVHGVGEFFRHILCARITYGEHIERHDPAEEKKQEDHMECGVHYLRGRFHLSASIPDSPPPPYRSKNQEQKDL